MEVEEVPKASGQVPVEHTVEPISSLDALTVDSSTSLSDEYCSQSSESNVTVDESTHSKDASLVEIPISHYVVKQILWNQVKVPIVLQNENGPCPLIAISNVLLLRGDITLPTTLQSVTSNQLIQYIADRILETVPSDLSEQQELEYQHSIQEVFDSLPGLSQGIFVNVKFNGVKAFEPTQSIIIFDLLNIPLYHGWLAYPGAVARAIGNLSYNTLQDRIIANKSSTDVALMEEAFLSEDFLNTTASQMTYEGLCELNSRMDSEEVAVLFRNNHLSTILKRAAAFPTDKSGSGPTTYLPTRNELFLLVTDQGFLTEPNIVWETLVNIEGDGTFVDGLFKTVPPKGSYTPTVSSVTQEQQINQDFLVALSLQEEQTQQASEKKTSWEEQELIHVPDYLDTDEQLARSLQQDEQQNANRVRSKVPGPLQSSPGHTEPFSAPVVSPSTSTGMAHQRPASPIPMEQGTPESSITPEESLKEESRPITAKPSQPVQHPQTVQHVQPTQQQSMCTIL